MAIRGRVLAILILLLATVVSNCVCLYYVGLNSLNYPRQWYNESFDPTDASNVTIRIRAMALGDTPVRILDSGSDRINISIYYYYEPEFDSYRHRDNYTVAAYTDYNDWAQGVGADIFVYLPRTANYTLNIYNPSASNGSVYKEKSPLLVNYAGSNLTVWLNDPSHPLPSQASALYY